MQLTLGCQIAKQLLGQLSLANNKNYRLNKSGAFPM